MPDKVVDIPGIGPVAFPESMSDDQIQAAAVKAYREGQGRPQSGTERLASWLPTVGGVAGGLIGLAGGPAAPYTSPIGAGLGGALGEAGRQALTRDKRPPMEQAKDVALEGAGQAAGEVVGMGLGRAMRPVSKWLMNRAITRVPASIARDFPDLAQTLIDRGLTVSERGQEKAGELLATAKAGATAALQRADRVGATVPVKMAPDLAESLKTAVVEQAIKQGKLPASPGAPIKVASIRDPHLIGFLKDIDRAAEQGDIMNLPATMADWLKVQLQHESKLLYANRLAPNGPKAVQLDATERAEFASRINDALGRIVPAYRASNAEAQPLIGAVRGLKQATRPEGNLYQAMVRPTIGAAIGTIAGEHEGGYPGAIAGAVGGAALTSPAGMSREAILLVNPAVQALLRQLPKPAAQRVVEYLTGSQP